MAKIKLPAAEREFVMERAGYRCEYCRSRSDFSPDPFAFEHIIPESRGGPSTINNLALSCQGCNNHKYVKVQARDPITGEMTPLYNPRLQRWRDHFVWNVDYTLILGISPTGRATVVSLGINRVGVVNIRRGMILLAMHPPDDELDARHE